MEIKTSVSTNFVNKNSLRKGEVYQRAGATVEKFCLAVEGGVVSFPTYRYTPYSDITDSAKFLQVKATLEITISS